MTRPASKRACVSGRGASDAIAMMTHDPRREVEKLREHLGTQEGTLTFLVVQVPPAPRLAPTALGSFLRFLR